MNTITSVFRLLTASLALLPVSHLSATTRYVSLESPGPKPPYTNWATAATAIQEAVDAAAAGDEIVVTNGVYVTGGRAVGTNLLVNRVAVDKPLSLRSVSGPAATQIVGGPASVRCVYLASGAVLAGFTLTNGVTQNTGDRDRNASGGGVWCEGLSAVVSNCVITGNSASADGGGARSGTLDNCVLTGNRVGGYSALNGLGGGACGSTLNNCTLTGNSAWAGGGAAQSTLNNCTLTGNSAFLCGGAFGCTLNNCIVYFNSAGSSANYAQDPWAGCPLNHCCTTPMPTNGVGNITNPPVFVDYASGNLRPQSNSPCINAGNNSYLTNSTFTNLFDLDGNPRIVSGAVDIGAYEFQGPGSTISYAWLQQFGLPTDGSVDALDLDADGHTTWQEWRCATCPTNPLSVLRLLSATSDGTNVSVSWRSVAGASYFMERATGLGTTPQFTPLATGIPGHAGTTTYTDTNAAGLPQLFYRVGVGPPQDWPSSHKQRSRPCPPQNAKSKTFSMVSVSTLVVPVPVSGEGVSALAFSPEAAEKGTQTHEPDTAKP